MLRRYSRFLHAQDSRHNAGFDAEARQGVAIFQCTLQFVSWNRLLWYKVFVCVDSRMQQIEGNSVFEDTKQ